MKKIIFLLSLVALLFSSCNSTKVTQQKTDNQLQTTIDIPAGYQPLTYQDFLRYKKLGILDKIEFRLSKPLIPKEKIEPGFKKEKNEIAVINGDVYEKHKVLEKESKIVPPSPLDSSLVLKYKTDYQGSRYTGNDWGGNYSSQNRNRFVVFTSKYGDLMFVFGKDSILRLQKTLNFKELVDPENFHLITPIYKYFYKEEYKKIE